MIMMYRLCRKNLSVRYGSGRAEGNKQLGLINLVSTEIIMMRKNTYIVMFVFVWIHLKETDKLFQSSESSFY